MSFALHEPSSLSEAIDLGSRFGTEGRFLAGGTDLIIQINRKRIAPLHIVSLSRLSDLSDIELSPAGFSIGALTTHKSIERHPVFRTRFAALGAASRVVGGHQVRNIATIGGNLVNASPAADTIPPLLALDSEVDLAGVSGSRRLPLRDFLSGPGRTERRFDEVLTHVRFKDLPPRSGTAFLKAGRRRAMEISIVCVAAKLTFSTERLIVSAAIALGAVGPTALRCPEAEKLMIGEAPRADLFAEAGLRAAQECAPISDVRASAEYRGMMVSSLVKRALDSCAGAVEDRS